MKKRLLLISILAAFIACIADVLLLYHPDGGYHLGDYRFLQDLSLNRILFGHYLGLLTIPFELLGIWVVVDSFTSLTKRIRGVAFSIAVFILVIGVAYHGMIVFVAQAIQHNGLAIVDELRLYFEPFGAILGVLFVVLCGAMIYAFNKGWSILPRSVIWFNPILTYLVLIVLYFAIPIVGNLLIVMGFNLAIAVFLLAVFLKIPESLSEA